MSRAPARAVPSPGPGASARPMPGTAPGPTRAAPDAPVWRRRVRCVTRCQGTRRAPAVERQKGRTQMRTEDMILVSVDDHVIEPRGMFDGLLPAKYQDKAPKLIRREDGTDVWLYDGNQIPNVGPQRGGRSAARGVRHRAHVARRHAGRLLRRPRAGARHVGQRRARLHVLPLLPPVLRPALRPPRGQGRGPRHGAGLQRLAHRPAGAAPSRAASSRCPSRSSGTPSSVPKRCAGWPRRAATP